MGAADVVPGVSGGTIAFITGIYPRLIQSLTSFDASALQLLLKLRFRELFMHVDAGFLIALFAGIFTAVGTLSHGISYLLNAYPVALWAFFFGLILASALWMLRGISGFRMRDVIPVLVGVCLILLISTSGAVSVEPTLPMIFFAGCIAISALLLPGVSGSFILLLMGLYASTIDAIKSFDFIYLTVFALGAGVGFLGFSRVINWLLTRWYQPTLLFLIGLLLGSLYVVWPWKLVNGDFSKNILPATYSSQIGEDFLFFAVLSALAGVVIVVVLESVFGSNKNPAEKKINESEGPPPV